MEAEAILRFALYKEVLKRKQRRKKRKLNHGGAAGGRDDGEEEGDESESDEEEDEEEQPARMGQPAPAQAAKAKAKTVDESQDVEMDDGTGVPDAQVPVQAGGDGGDDIRPERYVRSLLIVGASCSARKSRSYSANHISSSLAPIVIRSISRWCGHRVPLGWHCSVLAWLNYTRPRCGMTNNGTWPHLWRQSTRVSVPKNCSALERPLRRVRLCPTRTS